MRVIVGWPECSRWYYDSEIDAQVCEMVGIKLATRSVGSWFGSLINETTGIKVIPKKPCSSGGGGGGGGGGCSMVDGNVIWGVFFVVFLGLIILKLRYKDAQS